MGLEQIRHCSIQRTDNAVKISGVCKKSGKHRVVTVLPTEYDNWQEKAWPLMVSFPSLTVTEIRFLSTGVWE